MSLNKLFLNMTQLIILLILIVITGCSGSTTTGSQNSTGSPKKSVAKLVGGEITVTAANDDQQNPQVIYLADKNIYFSVWEDWRNRNVTGGDIYGKFINPDGTACGSEFVITNAPGNQTVPSAAYRPGDKIAVVWQNSNGTSSGGYVQYAGITGIPTGAACSSVNPVIGAAANAGFTQSKQYGLSSAIALESATGAIFSNTSGATKLTSSLSPASIVYGTVNVSRNSVTAFRDNGDGTLTGQDGSGTINYLTGAITVTRTDPVPKTGVSYDVQWSSYTLNPADSGDALLSRKSPKITYDGPRDKFWVTWNESRNTTNFASVLCFGAVPVTWTYGDTTFAGLMKLNPALTEDRIFNFSTGPEVIRNQETTLSRFLATTATATQEIYTFEYFTSLNNPTAATDTSSPEALFVWEGVRNKGIVTCTLDAAKGIVTSTFTSSPYDDGKLNIYGLFDKQLNQASFGSVKLSDLSVGAAAATATASNPSVAVDDISVPRKFLVAWEDTRDGDNTKLYGQLINSGGDKYNTNKLISFSDTNGDAIQDSNVANSRQTRPVISYDSVNQRYFVAWQDGRNGTVSLENLDIFGQYVDLEGTLRGGNYAITTKPSSQIAPALAYNYQSNQFLSLWKDATGITSTPSTASDVMGQIFSLGQPQLTVLKTDNTSLEPALIDFGNVIAGGSPTRVSFKVRNSGDAALKIDCISPMPSSPFSFENLPAALNTCSDGQTYDLTPAGEMTLTAKFSPTAGGSFNSDFTIKSDGGDRQVFLLGQGTPPTMTLTEGDGSSDGTLNYANVESGQTKDITLTITNNSAVTYNITAIQGVNTPFSIVNAPTFPVAMASSASLTLTIRYSPTAAVNNTAQLTIVTDKSLTQTVNLVGTGTSSGTTPPPDNGGNTGGSGNNGTSVAPTSSGGGKSGCFIATAAYGSYLDPHVMVLRHFRDDFLLKSAPGRAFVAFYYKHSPPIADFISEHDLLRAVTRILLTPLIFAVKYPILFALLLSTIAAGVVSFRKHRKEEALGD
ncbi:hypothetical protein OR1_00108 [Geobacter sp. OR-1]|uniref:CFI-box-CTERM domain-containing protein n=1 Tax=Geobacter sp. OR-1 TaxID=1266765 RepID=UPI000541E084|nr:CFI-box-CTERM domain-containing protein [Geobacter sp. OR-1]GAM07839.1 hypothetical protein OR1_00108 [Geobacter sp. OR-1]